MKIFSKRATVRKFNQVIRTYKSAVKSYEKAGFIDMKIDEEFRTQKEQDEAWMLKFGN